MSSSSGLLEAADVGAVLAVGLIIIIGILRVRGRLAPTEIAARTQALYVVLVLIVWFGLSLALARIEFFQATEGGPFPPMIAFGITVPILLGAIFITKSQIFGRFLAAVPPHWLIGVQVYRSLGVIFLIAHAEGILPGVFAIPAGYGDIIVGVTAILAATLVAYGSSLRRFAIRAWNSLGIADLVLAVSLGFFSSPGPLQLLSLDQPNVLISSYPMVLVPVFAVPLSILLHIASLTKLARETKG